MKDYELKENFDVSTLSSIKIGGTIKYLYLINTLKGLKEVLKIIKENQYDYYVIGGCTKILFPDRFMREVLIKINNNFIKETRKYVYVGAGVKLKALASFMNSKGYLGFAGLVSIPGDVGGAIVNNAGAFNNEISEYLEYVKVFKDGKIKKIAKKDLDFSYRNSIFKKKDYIIFEACFKKVIGDKKEILRKVKTNIQRRVIRQPQNVLTLGSTFKNSLNHQISKELEELGAKDIALNAIKVSEIHSNFLINKGESDQKNFLNILVILRSVVYNKLKYYPDLEVIILRW